MTPGKMCCTNVPRMRINGRWQTNKYESYLTSAWSKVWLDCHNKITVKRVTYAGA